MVRGVLAFPGDRILLDDDEKIVSVYRCARTPDSESIIVYVARDEAQPPADPGPSYNDYLKGHDLIASTQGPSTTEIHNHFVGHPVIEDWMRPDDPAHALLYQRKGVGWPTLKSEPDAVAPKSDLPKVGDIVNYWPSCDFGLVPPVDARVVRVDPVDPECLDLSIVPSLEHYYFGIRRSTPRRSKGRPDIVWSLKSES